MAEETVAEHRSTWLCTRGLCADKPDAGRRFASDADFVEHVFASHSELVDEGDRVPTQRRGMHFTDGDHGYINTYEVTAMDGTSLAVNVSSGPHEFDWTKLP